VNSLSVRLFAAFFAVIVLVIVIISLALLVLLRNSPLVERLALTQLNEAMRGVREAPAAAAPDAALTRYANQLASEYTVRALVVTEDGAVVSDSAPSAPPLRLNLRLARVNAAVPNTRIGRAREGLGEVWLFLARPLGPNRVLVLAEQQAPFPALQFFLDDLLEPLMQAGGVAALVALALSVLIARSVAGPLGKMAHVAQGIAHGDYAQAAPISGPEEVRALGQAINAMAQQVQTTQQAQRDFLANVSHDLKTPLTSIQGFAQAIQEGAAQSPEAIQRSASIIHAEAERMRRLVEGLLDLTKLNTSLSALQRAPLDLRALLASMLDRFALRAQDKGVTLTAELPDQLPSLKGDADRLAQVFGNLIDNALKYTPANGRVVLAAAARPDGVEISVQDNGPGIPPADLGRIFERFYQVEKSRARGVDGGVGLGLAISKEIVEAHGGALTAESVVGLGSKFTVRLPVALPDESTIIRRRKAV
jgi:signal transduction histidine kinase